MPKIYHKEAAFIREELKKRFLQDNPHMEDIPLNTYLGNYDQLVDDIRHKVVNHSDSDDKHNLNISTNLLRKLYSQLSFHEPFLDTCYRYISRNEFKTRNDFLAAHPHIELKDHTTPKPAVVKAKQAPLARMLLIYLLIFSSGCLLTFFLARSSQPPISDNVVVPASFEIHDPFNEQDWKSIWDGFIHDYYSYNDNWEAELDADQDLILVHRERYANPETGKFKFLFFIDSTNEQSYRPFFNFIHFQACVHLGVSRAISLKNNERKFMEALREKIDATDFETEALPFQHVEVYFNYNRMPSKTFFCGFKRHAKQDMNQRVCIWYLEKASKKDRVPDKVLLTTDTEFWTMAQKQWLDDASGRGTKSLSGKAIFEEFFTLNKR